MPPAHRELWLECARRAFAGLDGDSDGRLSVEALIGTLRAKLPAAEVDYAVEDALVEAGYAGGWLTGVWGGPLSQEPPWLNLTLPCCGRCRCRRGRF